MCIIYKVSYGIILLSVIIHQGGYMNKKILRKELMKKRDALTLNEIKDYSEKIAENLYNTSIYKESENIFIFVSYKSEVNTHNIIKHSIAEGKKIYVPVTDSVTKTMKASRLRDFSQLKEGYMHILEPAEEYIEITDSNVLDLVIVPGLLFDKNGYRIGYGGGFYDKFFASLERDVKKLGIGYDFQFTSGNIEHDDFDIPVDYFLSEKKFYIL